MIFLDGVGSESTWHARLNSLRSDILVFSPNADLAVYTNPPMNPGAGDYAAWTAFNQWDAKPSAGKRYDID